MLSNFLCSCRTDRFNHSAPLIWTAVIEIRTKVTWHKYRGGCKIQYISKGNHFSIHTFSRSSCYNIYDMPGRLYWVKGVISYMNNTNHCFSYFSSLEILVGRAEACSNSYTILNIQEVLWPSGPTLSNIQEDTILFIPWIWIFSGQYLSLCEPLSSFVGYCPRPN